MKTTSPAPHRANKYLITTAIDYTNDVIHIGHAYQKILADALARYRRLQGRKVFFVTGTDEHGQNIEKAAAKNNKTPKIWCDEISAADKEQLDSLNISYDRFLRTTDADHEETSLWFYQKVLENGDIYEGNYNGYYCESCEAYKTPSEIVNGHCELHPTLELKRVVERNFFFRWSKYRDFLKGHLEAHPRFVIPEARRQEMLSFLERGLSDIPVTRQNITWGFKAPNDPSQTIYVWFDALINYYTAAKKTGFWDDDTEIVHIVGKDNTRWHTLLWPAMLQSANLRLPDVVLNHGFLSLEGKKISKTLGNVIRPTDLVQKYGVSAVRYYLLSHGPLFDDADISLQKLEEIYTGALANGLGNHVSRVLGLCQRYTQGRVPEIKFDPQRHPLRISGDFYNWRNAWEDLGQNFEEFNFPPALEAVWKYLRSADQYLDTKQPWKITGAEETKDSEKINYELFGLLEGIHQVAWQIYPFLPETSIKIATALGVEALKKKQPLAKEAQINIKSGTVLQTDLKLFPRLL